jgi:glycosyltransferase involved in cell wall biosynthesis
MAGPTVSFLGFQSDDAVRKYFSSCRALLFPGEEDIGLTPIEAQATGCPVIAYGRGGALETVIACNSGKGIRPCESTGVFFMKQTPEDLRDALLAFESVESEFSADFIRSQVIRFDASHFRAQLGNLVQEKVAEYFGSRKAGKVMQSKGLEYVDHPSQRYL